SGGDRTAPHAPAGAAIADLQDTARDDSTAAVCVGADQNCCAGPKLRERAAAADRNWNRDRIGAVERQVSVVADGAAAERARRAAVTDLERSARDRREAAIAVARGQNRRSR